MLVEFFNPGMVDGDLNADGQFERLAEARSRLHVEHLIVIASADIGWMFAAGRAGAFLREERTGTGAVLARYAGPQPK